MTLKKSALSLAVAALLAACSSETEFNPTKSGDSDSKNTISKSDDDFGGEDDSSSSRSRNSSSSEESSSSAKSSFLDDEDVVIVDEFADLLVCSAKREGMVAFVKEDKAMYTCDGDAWRVAGSISEVINPVDTMAQHVADSILAAMFKSSSSMTIPILYSSSSVVMPGFSSSSVVSGWSSSYTVRFSSSSTVRFSSSSAAPYIVPGESCEGKLMCWEGNSGEYFVYTGLDNGTETSGYWVTFGDDLDGGLSAIEWPVPLGNEYSEDAMDPVIEYCGGVCGSFSLNAGTLTYKPFVGVFFNVAGTATATGGAATPADASAWGGLCITYTVDVAASLELGLGDAADASIGYDNPFVALPKSASPNQVCTAWSGFKQAGWGKGKVSGFEAGASLASVKFKIQAADGTAGLFNIISISSIY
ncbi:hypothetical protein [Fibrobacter sp. UBA4309]|uniref:hypothetical protein n=1 Tax=Fibrobacter sp. UBA4309 TaxID=1946537 RepID=UPI0025C5C5E2|nr:hypothetical protein [Fibrobacter sp. UBA4309]